jgi:hypothetical protein
MTPDLSRRYYLSSAVLDTVAFANAVRAHWGVENGVHCAALRPPRHLDTTQTQALRLVRRLRPLHSAKCDSPERWAWPDCVP